MRSLQGVPADQAAAEFEERAVNISAALETNTEAAEVMEPGVRTFNDSAILAKTAAMFGTALGDHRLDTTVDAARSRNHDRRKPLAVFSMDGRAIRESVESRRSAAAIA